jgi:hypothetical protein
MPLVCGADLYKIHFRFFAIHNTTIHTLRLSSLARPLGLLSDQCLNSANMLKSPLLRRFNPVVISGRRVSLRRNQTSRATTIKCN